MYDTIHNKMQVCSGRITLNSSISRRNFVGCLVHYFMLSFVFVSVDSLQPLLLQKAFQIDRKEQIENFKNALVITFDIVVKLLCAPVFGYLADRYGRKKINIYGILCISVTMFLMPYAPTYWLYVVLRCLYATGKTQTIQVPSPSPSFPFSQTTSATQAEAPRRPSSCSCPASAHWHQRRSTLACSATCRKAQKYTCSMGSLLRSYL